MATEDDKVDTGALATVVAVGTAGMIGISLAVNALVRHETGLIGAGRDQLGENAYRIHKEEQLQKLSGPPSWVNQGKGQVSMPIDRAMIQVLADLKRNPWNATPAPPIDAGAPDAATETPPDAGADAAATETDAGAAPEPSGSAPLSPTAPAPTGSAPTAPPRTLPPPTVPPAPPPPASAPAQPAPPAPPATKP